jgi:hypothetical protein
MLCNPLVDSYPSTSRGPLCVCVFEKKKNAVCFSVVCQLARSHNRCCAARQDLLQFFACWRLCFEIRCSLISRCEAGTWAFSCPRGGNRLLYRQLSSAVVVVHGPRGLVPRGGDDRSTEEDLNPWGSFPPPARS